jgi:hypothetical protein
VQSGRPLAIDDLRLGDLIEHPLGQAAVLGEGLHVQQSAVGGKADGPQGGQVVQAILGLKKIVSCKEVLGVVTFFKNR